MNWVRTPGAHEIPGGFAPKIGSYFVFLKKF